MTGPLVRVVGILALAFGSGALAQTDCQPRRPWIPQRTGLFYAKGEPGQPVQTVHVAAEVATNLMFPSEVNPALTKLIGGEGRFEPLMIAGRSVVVVPLRDLAASESFSLLVTLKDGTLIPLTLHGPGLRDNTDGQVDVYLDKEDPAAVRQALVMARGRVQSLTAENERHEQEGVSAAHAIATLLAGGRSELTPFVEAGGPRVFHDDGADIKVVTFKPRREGEDPGLAAVVFRVTNKDPKVPWALDEVRLFAATNGDSKPFALRAAARIVEPGKTEAMAVVIDAKAFGPERREHLVMEIWQKLTTGYPARRAAVELVMSDATTERAPAGRGKTR